MPHRREDEAVQTYQKYDRSDSPPADVYVGRRHSSRDDHFSGDHLHRRAVELDESSRRSRREVRDPPRSGQNRSITPDERKVALSPTEARRPARSVVGEGRQILVSERARYHRRTSSDSDSDSDTSSCRSLRRRDYSNRQIAKRAPYGAPAVVDSEYSRSISHHRHHNRDSDVESYSSSEEGKRPNANPQLPLKPKKLLYTGLACVATLAAGNNIYQSAKAHHSRRRQVEEGVMSVEEEKKLVSQGRMRDIISLGVAAVGAYNVRNGWRRAESHWQADAASKR